MARINGQDNGPRIRTTDTGKKEDAGAGALKVTTGKEQPARAPEATRNTLSAPVTDAFSPAPVSTSAASGTGGDLPAPVQTPAADYYRQRYDDFVRRNPGKTPPSYYLEYGQKYLEKFSALGPKDLSPAGLAWRDKTLKNLQDAIEKKRMEDPEGFAKLEQDEAAFKAFAYGTHPEAYLKAGLLKLPAQDLLKIATTPEMKDLLTPDGLRQVWDVLRTVKPEDVGNIAWATIQEGLRRLPLPHIELPHIELPKLPRIPIPHLPFGLG